MRISLISGLLIFFLLVPFVQACINPGLIMENGKSLTPFGGWLFIDGTEYEGLEIQYNLGIKNVNNQGFLVSLQPSSHIKDYISSAPVFVEANSVKNMPLTLWIGGKSVYNTVDVNYICEDGVPQFLQTYIRLEIKGKGISPPPASTCDSYGLDGCYSGMYRDYYCSNDELKYKETCTASCCQLFGGSEMSFCTSDKTTCLFPDPNEVLKVEINSPESTIYGDRKVLIDVDINSTAKYIHYALNTDNFRKACENCNSYVKEVSAKEGANELTIRAENYGGKYFYETTAFAVDSDEPKIRRIYPKDGGYIKGSVFTIQYTEENLKSITLFYGTTIPLNEYVKYDCPSGRNQECSIEIDAKPFDGQEIQYYFVVSDDIHSSMSDVNKISVDCTKPTVTVQSLSSQVFSDRKIPIDVDVTEQVVSLEMSDNGGKFRRLCRNCGSYSKTTSFKDGVHELTLRATDYAGNVGEASVTFTVDSKEPRIKKIYPKDREYVKGLATFTAEYDEDNPESVILFYGSDEYPLSDCPSGRRQECSATVDVSKYNGQEIDYYFVIKDSVNTIVSNVNTITVDSTVPSVTIHSPIPDIYEDRRVLVNIDISEEAKLEYSDNGGRYRRLCSNCDSYDRSRSFSYGAHELMIRATDEAGNEDYSSVTFTVKG